MEILVMHLYLGDLPWSPKVLPKNDYSQKIFVVEIFLEMWFLWYNILTKFTSNCKALTTIYNPYPLSYCLS